MGGNGANDAPWDSKTFRKSLVFFLQRQYHRNNVDTILPIIQQYLACKGNLLDPPIVSLETGINRATAVLFKLQVFKDRLANTIFYLWLGRLKNIWTCAVKFVSMDTSTSNTSVNLCSS